MKPRHIAMAGGLVIAGWLAVFGDKTPATGIAEPAAGAPVAGNPAAGAPGARETAAAVSPPPVAAAPAASTPAADKSKRPPVLLALLPREQLFAGARAESAADRIFVSQSWTPPPPPPPPPAPAPPPSAPPLPFTYLGKKIEDGKWEVYLARGEQTYVVREQSIIEGIYQVQAIAPPELSLTYLPLQQRQTMTIGGLD